MSELLALLLASLRGAVRDRSDLVAENLLLRHQLAVLTRPARRRPRLRTQDKLLWVLVRRLRRDWRRHLVLVRPEAVVRWHRRAWSLFWRWRSRSRLGRPRLSPEVRERIARRSRDNPRWGSARIRGDPLKLGIVVSPRSVRRSRGRPAPRPPSQTWRTFLTDHARALGAADLVTGQPVAVRTLHVLLLTPGRRALVPGPVTAHPTAAWVGRPLVEATAWGRTPRYRVRDRDAVDGGDSVARAQGLGIETVLTPGRAPRANAIAARVGRTLRDDGLAHGIPLHEAPLRAGLSGDVAASNAERPRRSLHLEPPVPRAPATCGPGGARPGLGGLHHVYRQAA